MIHSLLLISIVLSVFAKDLPRIQVHLVAHTHDDVGWLKTIDQYYAGTHDEIQRGRVRYIIDSSIDSLLKNEKRRFMYVEIAYFQRWWRNQSEKRKSDVRMLVEQGRLEFVNGGWCMNDEATTMYGGIIDQMTLGHLFLLKEFGVAPRVAWHIDPFGHSKTQASLLASMGFDGFMFGRVDHQDYWKRRRDMNLEHIWQGSESIGEASEIFTVTTFNRYKPPKGFSFDGVINGSMSTDGAIQNDPALEDYDLDIWADKFAAASRDEATAYDDGIIMMTMGSDFNYEHAEQWFSNLDVLVDYFASPAGGKYNLDVIYSTPSVYMDAKNAVEKSWSMKTDDFFPYSDEPHSFWTGYFSSRPTFKAYARTSWGYLQVCRAFERTAVSLDMDIDLKVLPSELLWKAVSVVQHHDGITGTARLLVTKDYYKRLARGALDCDKFIGSVLNKVHSTESTFLPCPLANISICEATETFQTNVLMSITNTLPEKRRIVVKFPVTNSNVEVYNGDGTRANFQLVQIDEDTVRARQDKFLNSTASYDVYVEAELLPMETAASLLVSKTEHSVAITLESIENIILENAFTRLSFSKNGIESLLNKITGVSTNLHQKWAWYESSRGTTDSDQPSGAYCFRPMPGEPIEYQLDPAKTRVIRGTVFDEVFLVYGEYISQRVRLYHSQAEIEIEYTVGEINVSDGKGREIISRFSTNLNSGKDFYTDANGREMILRTKNFRPTWDLELSEPVAGNYYPVNSRIMLTDTKANAAFVVMIDRSQGGSSLSSGELELMVHRRILVDDKRGLNEALDEDVVTRGKFWLILDTIEEAIVTHRQLSDVLMNPIVPFFSEVTFPPAPMQNRRLPKQFALPKSVHLLTYQLLEDASVLVRFSHRYALGEKYSEPVHLILSDYFDFKSAFEVSLTANQLTIDMKRLSWKKLESKRAEYPKDRGDGSTYLVLYPMEVRTFVLVD